MVGQPEVVSLWQLQTGLVILVISIFGCNPNMVWLITLEWSDPGYNYLYSAFYFDSVLYNIDGQSKIRNILPVHCFYLLLRPGGLQISLIYKLTFH